MKDLFQRNIDYLRISITDRCNFRCFYCMPCEKFVPMSHADILTYEEITQICEIAAELGISKIKLTGGEPLARKNVISLVKTLHDIDGIRQVTMTTNGFFLGEYAEELKAAGLDGVNISLDTLKRERFFKITGVDGLSRVLHSIEKSLEKGIPSVKINCVPMRGINEDEICALAAFAKEKPVQVRFIEMMPIGNGRKMEGIGQAQIAYILEESYGPLKAVAKKLGNGPASYYQPENFMGNIGFISAISHQFCKTCNRLRLTSDGILKPCLQYEGYVNLKEMLRGGVSKDEIAKGIGQAIREKPKCHVFQKKIADASSEVEKTGTEKEEKNLEKRMMTSIGG